MRAIGLMSGTSMDGVDVALIETDGEAVFWRGPALTFPFDGATRALLAGAVEDARGVNARTDRPGRLAAAEARITDLNAQAVEALVASLRLAPSDIAVVGFHGQTVIHRPDARLTVQLGLGAALARRLGIAVVADMRAADVAAGGQGAPLVPAYHRALARGLDGPRPLAVLNVGGVSNVTYLDGEDDPVACDTGPGNALLDDFLLARAGLAYDDGGAIAARGSVDTGAVARVIADPFFAAPPPKSLDRNEFREIAKTRLGLDALSLEDGAATLTALTAASVAAIVPLLPAPPRRWIVAGGGARNATLRAMLAARLGAEVLMADEVGWSSDALEAEAFAFLAVRALKGLALTFPATTGAPRPLTGGAVFRP
ncbi:anhydro-N-acetylmuramic acid kinase [Xanthobacter pseudotagetidis]|uniref:anhydro-N-acetylmuramic acid kinase n=1 Tax=Xanthobacter pseudotagetidis TaxID=3119911 RepID=UPI003729E02E